MLVVKELSQNIESHTPRLLCSMSAPLENSPSTAFQNVALAANAAEESSDDDEESFTLSEGIADWYFDKSQSTIRSYRHRINDMARWMVENYGQTRGIDTMRKKHVRLYFSHKAKSVSQQRIIIVTVKSLFKHLAKRKVMKVDPAKDFKSPKQLPPKFERNLSASDVRLFFKEASCRNDQRSHVLLQILVYGGLRLCVTANLPCSSIIKTEFLKNKEKEFQYYIAVKKAKGNKSRRVSLRTDIGAQIHAYAAKQSLTSLWMFPGKLPGKPMHPGSVSARVKRIAKKVGLEHVSSHHFRHFFCSNALHNGASLPDCQAQLGHADISTTSKYCHASKANVSKKISLAMEDDESGEDESIIYVKKSKTKNMAKNSRSNKKSKKGPSIYI